jgi:predicted RecA/RadA family phage recombinase
VYELPKVSAQAWAIGAPIYWDPVAKLMTTVTTSNVLAGYAAEVAANPTAVGRVRLCPHG